jgi:hypothetical protein
MAEIGFTFRLRREDHYLWDEEIREVFDEAARDLAHRVRLAIREQVYVWADLSEAYARFKELHDLDSRTLIAEGKYVQAIRWRRIPYGITVAPSERIHQRAQVSYRQLAEWLEYGTFDEDNNVLNPPRPHWRPVIAEFRKQRLPFYKERIRRILVRKMKTQLANLLRWEMKEAML